MGLLIRNGEIVTAADRYVGDVYCENGRIAAIGEGLEKRSAKDEVLDASGRFVLPGFVDPHVHMELPFMGTVSCDDFESGTASGLAGGTTTIIDFCIPARGQSLLEALRQWREKSKKAVADYTFHMAITGWGPNTADEMRAVVHEHGITSFKVFMAYKNAIMVDDGELYQVMKHAGRLGAVVTVHAENGDAVFALQNELVERGDVGPEFHPVSRPSAVEGEATGRALTMARMHGTTAYIVHMTCRESVEALVRAKLEGQHCYGETCPQYLLLDDTVFLKPDFEGASYVMSPPIRPAHHGHHEALWHGLENGMLDTVGTDHCPFTMEQKRMGKERFTLIPNGAAGIEDRLALLFTHGVAAGRFDLQRMVALGATNPARVFGLYPRKGTIAVGSDADLVLWDPSATGTRSAKTHHSRADRSIFEGFRTHGAPSHVVVNGRVQYADGKLSVERGAGRFLARRITPRARALEPSPAGAVPSIGA
jgi:dihydropyrimidinase